MPGLDIASRVYLTCVIITCAIRACPNCGGIHLLPEKMDRRIKSGDDERWVWSSQRPPFHRHQAEAAAASDEVPVFNV